MMLDELKKYIEFNFIYEFPEITLKQRNSDNTNIYSGPGALSQDQEGNLLLKMYTRSSETFFNIFKEETPSGKLIEDNKYYDITAKDMFGYIWKSEKVSLRKHYGQTEVIVIHTKLCQIFCQKELRGIKNTSDLILFINKNIQFPLASFFETPELKEKKFYNNEMIFCALTLRNYQIRISEQRDWKEIAISSSTEKLPENIDLRICEALQFISNTELNWFFYQKFEDKKNIQKLNSYNAYQIIEGGSPPLEDDSVSGESNWSIFKLYLQYIVDYPTTNKYHPISSLIKQIIQAEQLPIQIRFQTICVCIESLLNSEFSNYIDADPKLIEHQNSLLKFIDQNINEEKYLGRLKGLLSQIKNPRPVDKLYKLANESLIDERLIKNWKSLRHRMVHGERIEPKDCKNI